MKPATFRKQTVPVLCLVAIASLAVARADAPGLRLENEHYLVEVSRPHGLITRIRDKRGGLELLQEPRLADNFKFSLPLRRPYAWQSTEGNYILGREQRLTSHKLSGAKLVLEWEGPLTSVLGKRYDVAAVMTIQLADTEVRFACTVRNASKLEIGEVYYPILGGSLGLGDTLELRRKTALVVPGPLEVRTANIYHTFANFSWLGVLGPEQFYSYPDSLAMPWLELNHPTLNRAVYFGAHDPVARYKVIHLEMSPGVAPSRADGNWPRPEELHGAPAGVKFCFVHFPYLTAGRAFAATPVVLRCHDGNWRAGARSYGAWLATQGEGNQARADWLYRTPAFQQCGAVPFRELPAWAKAAAAVGVQSLLLTQWKTGGADCGVPDFVPDPRLGSREEFRESLRQCHALGVKVAVLVNLPPASQFDAVYRNELHRYACRDRWNIAYTTVGWRESSPLTGGFGAGERRVWLNPAHPGMRRRLVAQLRALAALGVDGVQLQDFFARPLDFNPTVGRTPDRASWEGGTECIREILQACRVVQPGFAVATDALWDRVLDLSQVASAEAREACPLRAAFNFWQPTSTVADDDSVSAINQALRSRARLRIAPADGQPVGGPATAAIAGYLKAILAVREALSHTLLDGEYLGSEGFRAEGPATLGVFRNTSSGLRTAVLVNARTEAVTLDVAGFTEAGKKTVRLWLPTAGTTNAVFPLRVEIPARQVAVLTEEEALDHLNAIVRWTAPARNERVVFDLASAEDLEGWTLHGNAFSVSSLAGLIPKATLNSLAAAGETATGTALSPVFTIEPRFDRMEIVFQGGWSQKSGDDENLVLKLLDAGSGAVLEQILPPGTHELTTRRLNLGALKGKSVRLQLIDHNANGTYAWIGLRKLVLQSP